MNEWCKGAAALSAQGISSPLDPCSCLSCWGRWVFHILRYKISAWSSCMVLLAEPRGNVKSTLWTLWKLLTGAFLDIVHSLAQHRLWHELQAFQRTKMRRVFWWTTSLRPFTWQNPVQIKSDWNNQTYYWNMLGSDVNNIARAGVKNKYMKALHTNSVY